jgi:hypothetical protein
MDAGFVDLVCFPSLVTLDRPGGSIWSNRHFGKGEQSARVAAGRSTRARVQDADVR